MLEVEITDERLDRFLDFLAGIIARDLMQNPERTDDWADEEAVENEPARD